MLAQSSAPFGRNLSRKNESLGVFLRSLPPSTLQRARHEVACTAQQICCHINMLRTSALRSQGISIGVRFPVLPTLRCRS